MRIRVRLPSGSLCRGEKTVADAILDRLVHDAHRLELNGESMRKNKLNINL